jgi:hypothetical protein
MRVTLDEETMSGIIAEALTRRLGIPVEECDIEFSCASTTRSRVVADVQLQERETEQNAKVA